MFCLSSPYRVKSTSSSSSKAPRIKRGLDGLNLFGGEKLWGGKLSSSSSELAEKF
jgi:hypothetical protein